MLHNCFTVYPIMDVVCVNVCELSYQSVKSQANRYYCLRPFTYIKTFSG